eukprot:2958012-Amphidinium_carterae.2
MTRPQSRVDHPYAAIQVTMSEPHQGLPAHRDAGNVGKSDIIGLGNYINGELWVASANGQHKLPSSLFPIHQTLPADCRRGSWHSINHRWYTFNGHNYHASKPYEGERISVIYFVPSGIESADCHLHEELRRLGFPTPVHPDRADSWHTPVDNTADEHSFAVDITTTLDNKADIKIPSRTVYVIAEQYRVLASALAKNQCRVLTTSHAHGPVHTICVRPHMQSTVVLYLDRSHVGASMPLHCEQIYLMVSSMCHPLDWLVQSSFTTHLEELKLAADTLSLALDMTSSSSLWQPHDAVEKVTSTSMLLATKHLTGKYDLMEIFGGQAGCSSIGIRRNMNVGQNVDIIHGSDVTKSKTRDEVLQVIMTHQPTVTILAPPCTAFSGWARYNRMIGGDKHHESLRNGAACSTFAARIVREQLTHGRHFILENPAGSDLFRCAEWQAIDRTWTITKVTFPQCALGLKSPSGRPMQKLTTIWTSSPLLVRGLTNLRCNCRVPHVTIQGSERGQQLSTWAATWPLTLCRRLVDGIQTVLQSEQQLPLYAETCQASAYPVDETPMPTPLPNTPFRCPACKRHLEMTHLIHVNEKELSDAVIPIPEQSIEDAQDANEDSRVITNPTLLKLEIAGFTTLPLNYGGSPHELEQHLRDKRDQPTESLQTLSCQDQNQAAYKTSMCSDHNSKPMSPTQH